MYREEVPWSARWSSITRAKSESIGSASSGFNSPQANINVNEMSAERSCAASRRPAKPLIILDNFADTSSAGSIIAFHTANDDFAASEPGLICGFGAGYSVGTVFVRKR